MLQGAPAVPLTRVLDLEQLQDRIQAMLLVTKFLTALRYLQMTAEKGSEYVRLGTEHERPHHTKLEVEDFTMKKTIKLFSGTLLILWV